MMASARSKNASMTSSRRSSQRWTRMGQLPNHEVGRVWRRPTAHKLPQPFYLRRARWRRAAVAAVPSPVALDGLPVCPALTMTRPVPFLLPVMVSPLLWSHREQRRPGAEAVEPRPSASPARHPGLELGAGKARSLRFPSPPLVPHTTGAPLSLLGTSAGALQRPPRSWVVIRHQPLANSRWSCRRGAAGPA